MLVGEVPREVILELGLQVPGRSLGLGLKHTSPLCLPGRRPYGACSQVILWGCTSLLSLRPRSVKKAALIACPLT